MSLIATITPLSSNRKMSKGRRAQKQQQLQSIIIKPRTGTAFTGPFRFYETDNEICKKVVGCISSVFDFLRIYGFREDKSTQRAFTKSVNHWYSQVQRMNGDWMAYAKYKIALFQFHSFEQFGTPPPKPSNIGYEVPLELVSGKAGSFLESLLRSEDRFEVISGVGIGIKKGMPRPGEDYLEKGATKAFNALTTVRPNVPDIRSLEIKFRDWGDIEDDPIRYEDSLNRDSSRRQVRRIVRELFEGTSFQQFVESKSVRPFPSTSSTSTSTRMDGGAFADLQASAEALGLLENSPLIKFQRFESIDEAWAELLLIGEEDRPDVVRRWTMNNIDLNEKYDRLYNAVRDSYIEGQLDNEVDIVALSEALKVRTITKGNGLRSFLLAPLQQFLWSRLASHKIFKLIGKPIEEEDILNALGRNLRSGMAYLSGDYSAATDNLCPWLSEMIAEEISGTVGLAPWMGALFREALTGHMIRSPDDERVLPQMWGQLMGSIVSFPVLCIANAMICRWVLEYSRRRALGLNDLNLLINGDDCVLKIPIKDLPVWEYIAKYHGLVPSVGKYFLSTEVIQMNSINFRIQEHLIFLKRGEMTMARSCPFLMVKYLNMGLFYGLGRSVANIRKRNGSVIESEFQGEDILNMSARSHELMRQCPTAKREWIFTQYLQYHREKLNVLAGGLPWFVPQEFGGLGLPIFQTVPDIIEQPDDFHRFMDLYRQNRIFPLEKGIAVDCHMNDLDRRVVGSYIEKGNIPGKLKVDSTLPIMQLATKYIPCKRVIVDSPEEFDSEAVQAIACLEVLFRKPIKVKEFRGNIAKILGKRTIQWRKQIRTHLGSKRSTLTILESAQKSVYPIIMEHNLVPYRFPQFLHLDPTWNGVHQPVEF